MAGAHPLRSEREELVRELPEPVVETRSAPVSPPVELPSVGTGRLVQPRLLIGLVLIVAGVVWAVLRGLDGYGLSTMNVIYDLDQPPVLLVLVGGWLCYRSRRG
jgi:hypothetical protein